MSDDNVRDCEAGSYVPRMPSTLTSRLDVLASILESTGYDTDFDNGQDCRAAATALRTYATTVAELVRQVETWHYDYTFEHGGAEHGYPGCTFPGCRALYSEQMALADSYTGWFWPDHPAEDPLVLEHDHEAVTP